MKALTSLETKKAYKDAANKGETACNVAVADFMNAPGIDEIDLCKYTGKVGDTITITDGFIRGLAQSATRGLQCLSTAANNSLASDKIIIRASDTPGHTTEKEQAL